MRPGWFFFAVAAMILVAGCVLERDPAPIVKSSPQRIVSLDYCADQLVLKLADRAQIAALSVDAGKEFSYLRADAEGIARVRDRAEDVIALRPDLVVRTYGGGPEIETLLTRAGIAVHQIAYAQDFADVRAATRAAGMALGQAARAERAIAEMDERLEPAKRQSELRALYVTPGGVTTGAGSLMHQIIEAGGFLNDEQAPGWRALPLERLSVEKPDVIITAFFNQRHRQVDAWSAAQHPVIARRLADTPVIALDGAVVACDAWFLGLAVETLRQAHAKLAHAQ